MEEYEIKKCFYCGEDANTKDHIIPVSYYYSGKRQNRHFTSDYGKENIVDCCRECNCIAGNKVFDNVYKKKEYIQERLTRKYKKVINSPFWSEEDINAMGKMLKREIKIQQMARSWALNRINYPVEMYPIVMLNYELKKFLEKEL
ncbi:HNH endonuclease [archaeon]|nr:HNH endonuclease [archaeon]